MKNGKNFRLFASIALITLMISLMFPAVARADDGTAPAPDVPAVVTSSSGAANNPASMDVPATQVAQTQPSGASSAGNATQPAATQAPAIATSAGNATQPAATQAPAIVTSADTSATQPAATQAPAIVTSVDPSATQPAATQAPAIVTSADTSATQPAATQAPAIVTSVDPSATQPAATQAPAIVTSVDPSATQPVATQVPAIVTSAGNATQPAATPVPDTVTSTDIAMQPAATQAPATAVSNSTVTADATEASTVAALADSGSVLIDQNGDPIPLASAQAAEILGQTLPDPTVCPAGSTTVTASCDPIHYTSITAAITAATPGSVIFVQSGTYTEQVVINKSLTLTGAGSASTTI